MGWDELFTIAARQHGAVDVADVEDCQVPLSTFLARARREGWPDPAPGVRLLPGSPPTPHQALWVAALATGGVAAGRSALWLHGRAPTGPHIPEVVLPFGRAGGRSRLWVARRSRTLREAHVTSVDDLPSTNLARTFADLAPRFGERRLLHEVVAALRDGALGDGELAAVLGDLPGGTPGRGILRDVLSQLEGTRSDSGFEHDVRTGLAAEGIPVHPEPYPWRCEDGVVVHLDIAVPEAMVYVETDGRRFHSQPTAFETDRARWTQIVRAWRPVWVTWTRWRDQRRTVIADVRRAIALGPPQGVSQ